jgi:hypothetical protein
MSIVRILLWALGILGIAYQLYVSAKVVRSASSSKGQKFAQLLFMWVLPVAGTFITHWVIHSTDEKNPALDRSFIREENTHW